MSQTNIYVLRLEKGRFYVGKSRNVEQRYQEHCQGRGSEWTRKYPPLAIHEVYRNVSPFEEDRITKEYMAAHGVYKVRGGSYSAVNLPEAPFLKKEIWGATDCCFNCGRRSHFSSECIATHDIYGDEIFDNEPERDYSTEDEDFEPSTEEDDDSFEDGSEGEYTDQICGNCGYHGHTKVDCYDY